MRPPRNLPGRLATFVVCVLAGALVVAPLASGAPGQPQRNADLTGLVREQRAKNQALTADVTRLRTEVDELTRAQGIGARYAGRLAEISLAAGLVPVTGPGVVVVLDDAPEAVNPVGVEPDLLVVHQQDIQAVMNALWSGGAEAMTLQGQRVVSTTGVKCVGNTVVIHGVPYAPPYRIEAIGDQASLERALADSAYLQAYRKTASAYQLGWSLSRSGRVVAPAFTGTVELHYARR